MWTSERDLHTSGKVAHGIDVLARQGHLYESDGALFMRTSDFGDDKDRVVRKSDTGPTYLLADIAYHYHKFQRGFERAIDFWGPDHHGYIPRMQGGMQALGVGENVLEVEML